MLTACQSISWISGELAVHVRLFSEVDSTSGRYEPSG